MDVLKDEVREKFMSTQFYTFEHFQKRFPKFPDSVIEKMVEIQNERVVYVPLKRQEAEKDLNRTDDGFRVTFD